MKSIFDLSRCMRLHARQNYRMANVCNRNPCMVMTEAMPHEMYPISGIDALSYPYMFAIFPSRLPRCSKPVQNEDEPPGRDHVRLTY
jgi:hypothetical protein